MITDPARLIHVMSANFAHDEPEDNIRLLYLTAITTIRSLCGKPAGVIKYLGL